MVTDEDKQKLVVELLNAQESDGGWSLPKLGRGGSGGGEWKSHGVYPTRAVSDGYATGLVVLALKARGRGGQPEAPEGHSLARHQPDPGSLASELPQQAARSAGEHRQVHARRGDVVRYHCPRGAHDDLGNDHEALAATRRLSASSAFSIQAGEPVPVVYCTDLYHPHIDADDHIDLATVFALPELDLKAILLDDGGLQEKRPGRVPVEQMLRLTGRRHPVRDRPDRSEVSRGYRPRPARQPSGGRRALAEGTSGVGSSRDDHHGGQRARRRGGPQPRAGAVAGDGSPGCTSTSATRRSAAMSTTSRSTATPTAGCSIQASQSGGSLAFPRPDA